MLLSETTHTQFWERLVLENGKKLFKVLIYIYIYIYTIYIYYIERERETETDTVRIN